MRRRLGFALLVTCSTLMAVAACVGDDPVIATTQTPDAAPTATTTTTPTTSSTVAPPVDSAAPITDAGSFCERSADAGGYLAPDSAYITYCADFDDPARDAGYKATIYDAGVYTNSQTSVFYSPPSSVFINPFTSTASVQRGAYLDWDISGTATIHIVAVRAKFRPQLDTSTHTPLGGYVELIKIGIGANDNVSFRYTYGRNLANGTNDYIGYSIASTHQTGSTDAGDGGDAGDAGDASTTLVFPTQPLPNLDWNEVEISLEMPVSGGASNLQLSIDNVTQLGATGQPVTLTPSADGYVQVGAHAVDPIDAPSAHSIDDVRINAFH